MNKYLDWISSKESIVLTLYAVLLFFLLTPGILVTLPPKGGKYIVALVHAVIFGIVWKVTSHWVYSAAKKS